MTYQLYDEVLWKRTGAQGHYLCRIMAIRDDGARPYTIEVLNHEWWEVTTISGTRRHVAAACLSERPR